ncbi:MAG: glycoside hydrolase family 99-like domain-containing protein [Verrucomicrobia bacterium]|nr:glycoside hydrolase family 99-like domain-containing protein [Verrucomicrobiota bacterium]MBU1736418.1 glycoside hydrolase family 99-like domain-containing protein [Verrucomicrobiota bacterium]MBU1855662.1 glycoside hydrolase family 99-like domain-containing protein [Verrucomicrobiota bacterium]
MNRTYDIAAFVWPSYHPDPRAKIFWPAGFGEWETVMNNRPKFPGHEQPRYPLWGYVNEADPCVMRMQIDAAADHGINVFIYDWYWYDGRPFLEGCLNDGYLKAANNSRVKFCIMWANHDVDMLWDKRNAGLKNDSLIWKGAVDRQEFEIIAHRIIERYFSHPSYYKIGDKPCFVIYDLNILIMGLGGLEKTRHALDWFRKETAKAGFKDLNLQLILRGLNFKVIGALGENVSSQLEVVEKLGFDGVTHYQIVGITDIDRDYLESMKDVAGEWESLSRDYKIPYYSHVSVGWDNNPRFNMFIPGIVKNNTPANFEKALRMAKAYVDARPKQAPLITLNSWNEWTETSYLQPCTMYGYGYLEAVKRVFAGQ